MPEKSADKLMNGAMAPIPTKWNTAVEALRDAMDNGETMLARLLEVKTARLVYVLVRVMPNKGADTLSMTPLARLIGPDETRDYYLLVPRRVTES